MTCNQRPAKRRSGTSSCVRMTLTACISSRCLVAQAGQQDSDSRNALPQCGLTIERVFNLSYIYSDCENQSTTTHHDVGFYDSSIIGRGKCHQAAHSAARYQGAHHSRPPHVTCALPSWVQRPAATREPQEPFPPAPQHRSSNSRAHTERRRQAPEAPCPLSPCTSRDRRSSPASAASMGGSST